MRTIHGVKCGILGVGLLYSAMAAGCATLPPSDEMAPVVRIDVAADAEQRSLGRASLTLTRSDLAFAHVNSALDAIVKLRPYFLLGSTRQVGGGPPEIALYVNNVYDSGGIGSVDGIPLEAIREIRFLHPTEARFRFGITCRCAAGAIVVTTIRSDR